MRVLVGDVGGTNARLATAVLGDGTPRLERRADYPSADFDGLAAVVHRYLEEHGVAVERACFAVACPVLDGVCRMPNLGWTLEIGELVARLPLEEVRLLNDFDAVGHTLPHLPSGSLATLQEGRPEEGAALALIGAGTGLGHGFVTFEEGRPRVHASEGGHADFASRSPREWALAEFLRREHGGRVSWERVLSGDGLVSLYRFLVEVTGREEDPATRAAMEEGDPAAVVSGRALDGSDAVCSEALDLFVSAYGAQAGNLALTVQALGGVYVAGGIAPRILPRLRGGAFLEAFRDKGRMRPMMERIPVRVVTDTDAGLLGAAVACAS